MPEVDQSILRGLPPPTIMGGHPKPRIVVNESVYHQVPGQQPHHVGEPWGANLVGEDQQVYPRRFKVDETWRPLEHGWIAQASVLHLANQEGRYRVIVPTKEELVDTELRVVELAVGGWTADPIPFAIVRPSRSIRIEPTNLEQLMIRCRHGQASVVLTLFPV